MENRKLKGIDESYTEGAERSRRSPEQRREWKGKGEH
jgi:hypothetical protein